MCNQTAESKVLLGAVMVLLLSCGDPPGSPEEAEPASKKQSVILSALGNGYALATGTGALATGAIFVPVLQTDGNPALIPGTSTQPRATCGVTFVSPHFAITAAHCVSAKDVPNPTTQSFTVESYDVSTLQGPLPTTLTGFFPNYTHPTVGPADGYRVRSLQCKVAIRCAGGNFNCPPSAVNADIAMIHCPERPATEDFPYLAVAQFDPTFGPVEMYWAHEILNVSNTKPPPKAVWMLDQYEHYKIFDTGFTMQGVRQAHLSNFHYHPNNQLFPLRSTPFPSGQQRQRLGAIDNIVMTDLFACHGTSGSGVMQQNNGALELLGPAVGAGPGGWTEPGSLRAFLCLDAAQQVPLRNHMTYINSEHTRALNIAAESDRAYWVSWFAATQG